MQATWAKTPPPAHGTMQFISGGYFDRGAVSCHNVPTLASGLHSPKSAGNVIGIWVAFFSRWQQHDRCGQGGSILPEPNVTTEEGCKAACLAEPDCVQITWTPPRAQVRFSDRNSRRFSTICR